MTRGTLVYIDEGRIVTSTEYNGDMGVNMDNGKLVMATLPTIKDLKSFTKFTKKLNKQYGYTNDRDAYYPCWKFSLMELFDMTEGYFNKYFSDYLYIINRSGETVFIKAGVEDKEHGFKLLALRDGEMGILNYGIYNPTVYNCPENQFVFVSPSDPDIAWAFEYDEPGCWGKEELHKMCSVRFNEDDKETYDYICEGYDIQEGDEVVVTGKKKQIVHVTVTDIFWATEKSLNEALPGGSSRFKKIQGKSVNVA